MYAKETHLENKRKLKFFNITSAEVTVNLI